MTDYRKLDVYWDARRLGRDVFRSTSRLEPYLRWRLGGQLDSAVESIGANLAEGSGRKNIQHGNIELIRYGHMAFGSACEVEHRLGGLADRELLLQPDSEEFNARIGLIKGKLLMLMRAWRKGDRGRG